MRDVRSPAFDAFALHWGSVDGTLQVFGNNLINEKEKGKFYACSLPVWALISWSIMILFSNFSFGT